MTNVSPATGEGVLTDPLIEIKTDHFSTRKFYRYEFTTQNFSVSAGDFSRGRAASYVPYEFTILFFLSLVTVLERVAWLSTPGWFKGSPGHSLEN